MKALGANGLRSLFLQFFAEKGHQILPSASLVPARDPTLLLVNAGMVPFKPYYLGLETSPYARVTTCQRCVRTGDIDNVGKTDRHHTFFEMLGNFSFGDYFKREAIAYAWEFVTERLEIEPERLWVSIYHEDDEAFDLWHRMIGLPAERIVRLGRKDNFWEIGVGPCGPCSEIHYDRGESYGCGRPDCAPGCDHCERYLEFWNLVFIQYHQDEEGRLTPLKTKGIDTGMGLERTAALLQGKKSNFDIDVIRPIIDRIAEMAGVPYGQDPEADVSMRVITDHIRGITFMVLDGIVPGNEGRSYVLRRLLRRAVRHARLLGIKERFLGELSGMVADLMKTGYPEVEEAIDRIRRVVAEEEARFHETLDQGIEMLDALTEELVRQGRKSLAGEDAFRLYDTYGFPPELTEEILAARGLELDKEGFERAMEAQRARARAARGEKGYLGTATLDFLELDAIGETSFIGYDTLTTETSVAAIVRDGERVDRTEAGDRVDIVLPETPFYPEGGGQVADTGTITAAGGQFLVEDVRKLPSGVILHRGRMVSGGMGIGERVQATVDQEARRATERNHTATHLLHLALRERLGRHAQQAGSLVAPDRLRFDFTHFQAVSSEELAEIEARVNDAILQNLPVSAQVTSYQDAMALGAMALFGEKYGNTVRMVSIGDVSRELCGGTHVRHSAELGLFKIVSENGIAAGVRRIEAVTGGGALTWIAAQSDALARVAGLLQAPPLEAPDHLGRLIGEMKSLEKEVTRLKSRLALSQAESLVANAEDVDGLKVVVSKVEGMDTQSLRSLGDKLLDQLGEATVVLGSVQGNRVQMIAMATPGAAEAGVKANEVLGRAAGIVSGGGGGNARMAQAGGKDASRLGEALSAARQEILHRLRGNGSHKPKIE